MTHGNGVSRGDRNRNARLARLRELVPLTNAGAGSTESDLPSPRHIRASIRTL